MSFVFYNVYLFVLQILYTLLKITTLLTVVSSNALPQQEQKNNPKRQISYQPESSTPPCSLSIFRYLYNKPGTKIRPNLPAGTVIFGKALPPLTDNNLEQSGSRIDAPEQIKPDRPDDTASASDTKFGYLPPDNSYLPPPKNPSYGFQKKPNYFFPIGITPKPEIVSVGSSSPSATDDAIIVSSTPGPEHEGSTISSTVNSDFITGISTVQPEVSPVSLDIDSSPQSPVLGQGFLPPSSTFVPDFSGIVSSTPAPDFGFFSTTPAPAPDFSVAISSTPAPEFTGIISSTLTPASDQSLIASPLPNAPFEISLNPDETLFNSQGIGFPVNQAGTRCTCEDGRIFFTPTGNDQGISFLPSYDVSKHQLTNDLVSRQNNVIISTTQKPFSTLRPIVVGDIEQKLENSPQENNINFSLPTPKPIIETSTPAPTAPFVLISSTTSAPVSPDVVISSTTVVPEIPAVHDSLGFGSFLEKSGTFFKQPSSVYVPNAFLPQSELSTNILYQQPFLNYPVPSPSAIPQLIDTKFLYPAQLPEGAQTSVNIFPQQVFRFPAPPAHPPSKSLIQLPSPTTVPLIKYSQQSTQLFPSPSPESENGYIYPKPQVPFPQPSYPAPPHSPSYPSSYPNAPSSLPPSHNVFPSNHPSSTPPSSYPSSSPYPTQAPSTPPSHNLFPSSSYPTLPPHSSYPSPPPSVNPGNYPPQFPSGPLPPSTSRPQPSDGYHYPKPSIPFPPPSESGEGSSVSSGYNYPKPKTQFSLPGKFASENDVGSSNNNDNLIVLKV